MSPKSIPNPEDVPILSVPEAGRLAFNLSNSAAYAAAKRGELPTIKVGRRIVVPTAALRRLLGMDISAEAS